MKVKTILVSQPKPKVENSPYFELEQSQRVKIDFIPFIHVEGVSSKEVRVQKVDLNDYTAIILTSRNAVDHFFRIAEEMRFKVPIYSWLGKASNKTSTDCPISSFPNSNSET